MSEIVVSVDHLSKKYALGEGSARHRTLREVVAKSFLTFRGNASKSSSGSDQTIWALKDLSFDLRHGEVLGIVGRNGSGKSTLLKILSRITEPTSGSVDIYGRVNSLLEVGTGFHSELTGRENIYLNGAILGMRKTEIERKFDEIVEFAEIDKFLDTPIKHYSSGMSVRLAFAVAAHMEPDILIVDEVLAVGDAAFQQKCLGKMSDVARVGRTILFVSHNMTAIGRLCNRAILMNAGQIEMDGPTGQVIEKYLLSHADVTGSWSRPVASATGEPIDLLNARVLNPSGEPSPTIAFGEGFDIEILYRVNQPAADWWVLFRILDNAGQIVLTSWDIDSLPAQRDHSRGIYRTVCSVPGSFLKPAVYAATLATVTKRSEMERYDSAFRFEISSEGYPLNQGRMGSVTPILRWSQEKVPEQRTFSESDERYKFNQTR